jgi:hypothetical protein
MSTTEKKAPEVFIELADLSQDHRIEVRNAQAAVKVWMQLKDWGVPKSEPKFLRAYKRYKTLCAHYHLNPVIYY